MRVGLAEWETDSELTGTTAVASVGETASHTREFVGKWARDKQANCIVPSLAPPPQAAPQCSKEGCPALVNTQGFTPLQFNRCAE